uniref:Syntaxin 6/10/61 N-terminal domain-containing protein n=1 Tax=Salix viminalis TaxID=40686 RepID=A0A6N2MR76_SALVM
MMVANSFDLWQKDAFFSAAEEVQESADVMESAYRMWIREKREGSKPEDLDQVFRELQTALGTAKWQLEEFERAVRLSCGHRTDDFTASRHKQFVAAIESQISLVEAALREAFSGEGKQPLRWVNLDKEERDDLAMFLSGTIQIPENVKDDFTTVRSPMKGSSGENHPKRKKVDHNSGATCSRCTSDENEFIIDNKNGEFIIDIEEKENLGMRDDIICQVDKTTGSRRTWSSPNFGAMKIMVARDDKQKDKMKSSVVEATSKEKGHKPFFLKQRCGEHSQAKGSITLFNQAIANLTAPTVQLFHTAYSCFNAQHFLNRAFSSLFSLSSITLLIIEVKGTEFLSEV